jgi:hypothetical protein
MAFTATQYLFKASIDGHDRRYGWQLHRPGQYEGHDCWSYVGQ